MKKILIFASILIVWGGQMSCTDWLDTEPKNFIKIEDFYQTPKDLKQALGGVYASLGTTNLFGTNFAYEAVGDDLGYWLSGSTATISVNKIYGWNYTASQPNLKSMWGELYTGIERANQLLEHLDISTDIDEKTRETYRAEAIFMRAFYHYMLASYWGDIPLKLQSTEKVTEISIKATPQADVFLKCKEDMEATVAYLDSAKNFNHSCRVSNTVALGILARLCLKMAGEPTNMPGMYEQALLYADSVVNSGQHRLNDSYDDIFIRLMGDQYDTQFRESMWEADFHGNSVTDPGKGNSYSSLGAYTGVQFSPDDVEGTEKIGYCYSRIKIRPKLVQLYLDAGESTVEPFDLRFNRSIAPYTINGSGVESWNYNRNIKKTTNTTTKVSGKWRRNEEHNVPRSKNNTSANFPILRYADVLLMQAEAENKVNGPTQKAHDALNEVRRRAGVPLYGTDRPMITDPTQFDQLIRDERARELCFEGLRKYDLVRWGIFVRAMKEVADPDTWLVNPAAVDKTAMMDVAGEMWEKYNLFPIPQSELNTNREMKQNKYW